MTSLRDQIDLLPAYLGGHLVLSFSALATGALLSAILTLIALRWRPIRSTLLSLAGIVQTVPSLALLALMVPVLGRIGFLPAWIALTAYSVLPMLRNAITGITQVDANILEAARGVGMTERQSLVLVQLPLAAPVILAGVRTATVWVIGIATLATPVGATSLGNYIFSGLQTQRFNVVLLGCVAAAALALVMDGLIRILEIAATRRSRALGAIGVLGLLALIVGGLAPSVIKTIERGGGPRVVIGAKTFTEQHILTELIAMKLEEQGFSADRLSNLGSTIVFDALTHGRVDVYVDYTGTIWANHMKRDDVMPAEPMRAEITSWLRNEYGIELLGALGFENAYALAMTRERAAEFGLTTFEDLARVDHELIIAGDYEFFARPEWTALVDAYGFDFRDQRSLDSTLMYQAVDQDEVDVISAFSTDGRIAAFDLVLLDDTRDAFPPYEAILLVSDKASHNETLIRILQDLIGSIPDEMMREANRMVDLDKQSPQDAARWLAEHIDANQPRPDASTD